MKMKIRLLVQNPRYKIIALVLRRQSLKDCSLASTIVSEMRREASQEGTIGHDEYDWIEHPENGHGHRVAKAF